MISVIDEPVKVGVVFGCGKKVKPVWFIWNENRHEIKEVTYSWISKEGRFIIYHFSVTDGNTLYEICYNANDLTWKLISSEVE